MATGARAKRVVLLLWLLVVFFYFYLSYDYIRVSMADKSFDDYMHYVVQIAGTDHRPAKEVRALLLVKAEELALPIRGEDIKITGGGESLSIRTAYDSQIDIPLLQRVIYTKHFDHEAKYKVPGT